MNSAKCLSDVLKRGANNFDILRLIAALAVIVGHAYAIAPQPGKQDKVLGLLHFDYSGSLAVKFFFFLSGLLVTNSIIQRPDPFRFMVKRAFRIFPGLLICLLVTVLIIGPIFTDISLGSYLKNSETWKYITRNLLLIDMQWKLPGVFTQSKYGPNGSLWTLPYEVSCYLYLAVLYGLGLLKNRVLSNIIFLIIIGISFISPVYLPVFFSQNPESHLLPACFAMGAIFANNGHIIKVDVSKVILLWILVTLLKSSGVYQFIFYVAFFYTTLYVASNSFICNKLKIPFDASYGIYIYGFLVQQCIHSLFPEMGVHGNQLFSCLISIVIGIMSWYLVEKRFIKIGNNVSDLKSVWFSSQSFFTRSVMIHFKQPFGTNNYIVFIFLILLAIVTHAVVLKFIFPGYYSPLYPQHSDFYIPAAFANSQESFWSLLSWPRPVNMIFAKLIGYFGIHGSIACVIVVVCMNTALAAMLMKRIFKIPFDYRFVFLYIAYCYLLFSHPYFYTFYAQDIGAQLSFFLLVTGVYLNVLLFNRIWIAAAVLFILSLLAFLSKETYGLAFLFFCFLWFIYYKRTSILKSTLPFFVIGFALTISFVINIFMKSVFVDPNASSNSPYHIDLKPVSFLKEIFIYATEAINPVNLILVLLLGYIFIMYKGAYKKELLYVMLGCVFSVLLSWLPNAILPNHHYKGYSFNGAYMFYLPIVIISLIWSGKFIKQGLIAVVFLLCLISPLLNIRKYRDNNWVIIQENTQRNLLSSIDILINKLPTSDNAQRILIKGITFPFHPFAFPQSLRVFPKASRAVFDVVSYQSLTPANPGRVDLVKFIDAKDTAMAEYDREWIFDSDGKLIKDNDLAGRRIWDYSTRKQPLISINRDNWSQFTMTGFYAAENGIRWTNGRAVINSIADVMAGDTVVVELNTYLPPICKDIIPVLTIYDVNGVAYKAIFSVQKENSFCYLFNFEKSVSIRRIEILSDIVDASPDQRMLSFPFVSLVLKK